MKFSRKPQPTYALPNQALDLCQSDLAAAVGSYIRFEGQRRCTEGKAIKNSFKNLRCCQSWWLHILKNDCIIDKSAVQKPTLHCIFHWWLKTFRDVLWLSKTWRCLTCVVFLYFCNRKWIVFPLLGATESASKTIHFPMQKYRKTTWHIFKSVQS